MDLMMVMSMYFVLARASSLHNRLPWLLAALRLDRSGQLWVGAIEDSIHNIAAGSTSDPGASAVGEDVRAEFGAVVLKANTTPTLRTSLRWARPHRSWQNMLCMLSEQQMTSSGDIELVEGPILEMAVRVVAGENQLRYQPHQHLDLQLDEQQVRALPLVKPSDVPDLGKR
ncbi:hypothetical protein Cni_G26369 [Canna indica]|uniref:Uncharacterized protein n=1 Tax=Canna indica TaxID=4628 RepID=A0AAQ3L3M4_9LILI|nr:hypothetical protein Cni_G26369 [Canna indica]